MSGVNKVIILGRLGTDPEFRSTPNGAQVCTLSVATSENWVKDGKKEERTEWHRVIFWGKQAELAGKYLKKGRQVYLEGRLQTRSWQDAQGQKRFTTEIVGNTMQFIDSGNKESSFDQGAPPMDDSYTSSMSSSSQSNFSPSSLESSSSSDFNIGADIPF